MQIESSFRITEHNFVPKIQTIAGIGQATAANALRIAGKNGKAVLTGFIINGKFKKVVLESHWKRTLVKK